MPRITKRLVDGLKAGKEEYFIWDDKHVGFGVRVQPSGAMSYVVKYRAGSGRGAPTRRVTLNQVGKITPDQARDLARKVLGSAAHGSDPAATKAAGRRAATLGEVAECFLAHHAEAKRKASTAELRVGAVSAAAALVARRAGGHIALAGCPQAGPR
jgi:Arm DNA-binding domain